MIKIGEFNELTVVRKADFGYYLDAKTGNTSDDILIPNKSTLGKEVNIGDTLNVFIYRDSEDRLIATLKEPLAKVGELCYLTVVSTTTIGSFIESGLERDILVPFKEKVYPLKNGDKYLFYIYLDKTNRIAATTRIDKYLESTDKFQIGEEVTGTVYGFQTNESVMVAIDNKYKGVILKKEYYKDIKLGEVLKLRVKKYYEEGIIGLSTREGKLYERDKLEEIIINYLKDNNGFMPYNDKSSPEDIKEQFNTSKNYFKIALGGLMKRGLVIQEAEGTKLK